MKIDKEEIFCGIITKKYDCEKSVYCLLNVILLEAKYSSKYTFDIILAVAYFTP